MQRLALVCAALGWGIFGSPAIGQQAVTTPPQTAQAVPQETVPPQPQAEQLPPPPPFPPYPKAKPSHRWVDVSADYPTHKRHRSKSVRHHVTRKHHSSRTHHKAASKHSTRARHTTLHLSRRTVRQCHAMTYQRIMHYPNCRALMRQDLAAKAKHDRSAHRHSAHKTTRRHHTTRHRRK